MGAKSQAPVPPLVYGYVRSAVERPDYMANCKESLATWAARQGWHLGGVFTDIGAPLEARDRIGFRGLLQALALSESVAAIALDSSHLSHRPDVVATLVNQIRRTGAAIWLQDGELPDPARSQAQGQPEYRP